MPNDVEHSIASFMISSTLKYCSIILLPLVFQNFTFAQVSSNSVAEMLNSVDTVIVNERLPRYILTFTSERKLTVKDDEYPYVDKIKVRKEDDTTLIQELSDGTNGIVNFKIFDLNFDGYADLQLDHNPHQELNEWSTYFPFDKDKGRFEFNDAFSHFTDVKLNPKDSLIISSIYRGSHGDEHEYYKIIGGLPVLVKRELNSDDSSLTAELIHGKMTVIDQTSYTEKQDSAGKWYRDVIFSEFVDSVLRTTKIERLRSPLPGEPTPTQRRNGLYQEDFHGKYLLQRETAYNYGKDEKGRKYRDVVQQDVVKDKLTVTKKFREYFN